MNLQTPSSTLACAITVASMSLGMAPVAMAQTSSNAGGSIGVSNVSTPRSAAPVTPAAATQAAVTQTRAPGNASLTPPASNRVGDATNHLLKLQAEGQHASRNAYPMTSDVALRTYQRYLESFTHKIPENLETQVSTASGGSR